MVVMKEWEWDYYTRGRGKGQRRERGTRKAQRGRRRSRRIAPMCIGEQEDPQTHNIQQDPCSAHIDPSLDYACNPEGKCGTDDETDAIHANA